MSCENKSHFLPPAAIHGRKIKVAGLLARSAVFLFKMVDEEEEGHAI